MGVRLGRKARRFGSFAMSTVMVMTSFSTQGLVVKADNDQQPGRRIISFSFDDEDYGFESDDAVASMHGGVQLSEDSKRGKAIWLNGKDGWLNVTNSDGESILTGLDEMTISYYSKAEGGTWSLFAAPDDKAPTYQQEHYLGVLDQPSQVRTERYDNQGTRSQDITIDKTGSDWKHVVITLDKEKTTLYVDDRVVSVDIEPSDDNPEQFQLTNMLGENSVLQIGKGNWGNGEYYKGYIDEFEVYNFAMSEEEVSELDKRYELSEDEKVQDLLDKIQIPHSNDIRGNITLPTKNEYGATISWKSSNTDVITDEASKVDGYGECPAGVVTRGEADTSVILTATVDYEGNTYTKDIEVTVKQKNDYSREDLEKYMFVYFPDNANEQIYFALGEDAFHFQDMNDCKPVMTSSIGDQGVRDPYIFRSYEGDRFYMIATDLKVETTGWDAAQFRGSLSLVIWESDDLVNWSKPRLVDTGIGELGDMGCVWAPEAIYDTKTGEYVVFWASMTDKNHQIVYYAKTRDFVNFTTPVKYIDRGTGNHCIDTTMILAKDGKYYRASADGQITIETSDSVLGEWTKVTTLLDLMPNMKGYDKYAKETNVKLTGGVVEGPELFELNEDGTYGLYVDNYGGVGYIPITTTDLSDTTGEAYTLYAKKDYSFGAMKKRHGSILGITNAEYEAMKNKWGLYEAPKDEIPDENKEEASQAPILSYNFDEKLEGNVASDTTGEKNAKLVGKATYVSDTEKGQVLYLDGSNETYLEFPRGFFDGRNQFTLSMDVKAETVSGNFFVFAVGQNNTKYIFFKTEDKSSRLSITTSSWQNEQTASGVTSSIAKRWAHWDVVVTPERTSFYLDGELVGENNDITIPMTELGSNLIAYLGKSFYTGDAFFKGSFDNVEVYNRALTADEILTKQGKILDPVKKVVADGVTWTRKAQFDAENEVITLFPSVHNSTVDLSRAEVEFELRDTAASENADKQVRDLTKDFKITITYDYNNDGNKTAKEWTVHSVICGNPVLGGQFADPDIDIFGDTYYIYPTTDGYNGWSGTQFHVFSSKDLVEWEDHGVILDLATSDVEWSDGSAWAPSIEEKNGKYYFYFCGNDKETNTKAIGVAVADSPVGPFVALKKPLITNAVCKAEGVSMGQAIDPSVFTDEDGTSYLYFGNGKAAVVQLNDDMTSIVSGTMENIQGLRDFRESVVVVKRGDVYHFTWSCDDTGSENYSVNYGTSDSLYGPVDYQDKILSKVVDKDILGTGHHSIVQLPGEDEYYIAYHRFVTPLGKYTSGFGFHRETCIDKLTFDEEGYINKVIPTLEGVKARKITNTKVPSLKESTLANFTFDNLTNGIESSKAKATVVGEVKVVDDKERGKVLSLTGPNYLSVTDTEGNSLLSGLDEITISYYSKHATSGWHGGWPFFAAPNTNKQSWPNEHYLGILDKDGKVLVERYNNNGSRPATNNVLAEDGTWNHVMVVVNKETTTLYVNGENETIKSSHLLSDILKDESILNIGRANWDNGEFYNGLLDDFVIYNRALSEKEIETLLKKDIKQDEEQEECELVANYTFEELKGNVENDTVVKDKTGNGFDAVVKGNGASVIRGALRLPGGAANSTAPYVEIPASAYEGQETITVSLWLQNSTGKGDYTGMFLGTKPNQHNRPTYYWLLNPCNPQGYFKSVMTNQSAGSVNEQEPYKTETAVSSTTTDSGWSLYTTVIKPGSITGYYNGKKVSTSRKSVKLADFGEDLVSYIGKSSYADKYFNGQVKDVRIYKGALSDEEIKALYTPDEYTYPVSDVKATDVELDIPDEVVIKKGEDLPHDVTITLNDGTTVKGYVSYDKDVTKLLEGEYEVTGRVDYFPYPLVPERADPYVYYDEESKLYYLCGSWPAYGNINKGYDRLALRCADTLAGLATAKDIEVWHSPTSGADLKNHIWAPELHKINGDWYIFFAGSTANNVWAIRPFVLKCEGGKDILDKNNWAAPVQFKDKNGNYFGAMTLDMTYFENNGHHYVIWADCGHDSDLIIGEIDPENPYQLISDRVILSEPEYSWERVRIAVNEGPAILKRNGKIYLAYSASATGDEYCVGLMEIDETKNVLDPDNWKKYPVPVLSSADAKGEYGPGHNSFSVDENGNIVMIYHARDEKCHSNKCGYSNVDSLYDPCRNALIKYVRFDENDQPIFSSSADTEIPEGLRTVKIRVNIGNLSGIDKAKADLDEIVINNLEDVRGNITLPTTGTRFDSEIIWTSSDTDVISETGIVNRTDKNEVVTLTAKIKVTDGQKTEIVTKEFTAKVVKKAEVKDFSAYLFAYFTGEGYSNGEQIYFATSEDGLHWEAMNEGKPVITSGLGEGGLRDPYIMRSPEGDKFYLIATDLRIYNGNGWGAAQENGSKSIMVWESTDLVNWSDQRMVEVAPEGAGCTWAPEAFYDYANGEYVVFWSSKIPGSREVENNDNTHRVYYATTRDFYTFSEPKVWIELHNPSNQAISVIDATVIKVGEKYYRFTKNEATQAHKAGMPSGGKYIMLETSDSLLGKWTEIAAPNVNKLTGREGATCFKFNNEDKWCLLIDNHGNGGYHPLVTDDLGSGDFTALTRDEYSFPSTMRHGSVLNITSSEYRALLRKYNNVDIPEPSTEEPSTEEPSTEEPTEVPTEEPTEAPSKEEPSSQPAENQTPSAPAAQTTTHVSVPTPAVTIDDEDIPLASTFDSVIANGVVDVTSEMYKHYLRFSVYEKYLGKASVMIGGINEFVGFSIDMNAVRGIGNTNINLDFKKIDMPGFAAGFDTIKLVPAKTSALPFDVTLHVNTGKENVGRAAYIFRKSLKTNQYELRKAMIISEIGNVSVTTDEITEFMILIQK